MPAHLPTPFTCPPSGPPPLPAPLRLYPLNQRDMPLERKQLDFGPLLPASVTIDNPSRVRATWSRMKPHDIMNAA